jgi:mannose-6-phosphate isomerase
MPSVFKIIPTTQRYDWGKRGSKSKVAQLAVASKLPGFQLDENAPYAEVILVFICVNRGLKQGISCGWEPTFPLLLRVATSGDLLSDYLKQNQDDIGAQIANRFGVSDGVLPFLFKVLSIEKALSIQTHPDKATAEKLHAEQPHIYRGAHKQMVLVSLAHSIQMETTSQRWQSL